MKTNCSRLTTTANQVAPSSASHLTKSQIENCFHLPMHQACIILQCSIEELRVQCRVVGIQRWPYRKRNAPLDVQGPVGIKRTVSDLELSSIGPVSSPIGGNSPSSTSPVSFTHDCSSQLFQVYSTKLSKTSKQSKGNISKKRQAGKRKPKAMTPAAVQHVAESIAGNNLTTLHGHQTVSPRSSTNGNMLLPSIVNILSLPSVDSMINKAQHNLYTTTHHMFLYQ